MSQEPPIPTPAHPERSKAQSKDAQDRPFTFPGPFYAMADTLNRPDLSCQDLTRQLCAGGARLLQLRLKQRPTRDFLALATEVQGLCQRSQSTLIINDRVDIALAVAADGVHLGQEDLPLAAARTILGRDKIIGVSTHTLQQALSAEQEGADYIGFGPLFGTTTKATGYTARGLEQLQEIRQHVRLPIVAIGGITVERAPAALQAGADAVALISDIVLAPDIRRRVKTLLHRLDRLAS